MVMKKTSSLMSAIIWIIFIHSFTACNNGVNQNVVNKTPAAADFIVENLTQTAGSVTAVDTQTARVLAAASEAF